MSPCIAWPCVWSAKIAMISFMPWRRPFSSPCGFSTAWAFPTSMTWIPPCPGKSPIKYPSPNASCPSCAGANARRSVVPPPSPPSVMHWPTRLEQMVRRALPSFAMSPCWTPRQPLLLLKLSVTHWVSPAPPCSISATSNLTKVLTYCSTPSRGCRMTSGPIWSLSAESPDMSLAIRPSLKN